MDHNNANIDNKENPIIESVRPESNFNGKAAIVFVIFNLISILTIIYYSYNVSKILVLKDTDDKILAGAYGVTFALGREFHDRIENASSISEQEHYENILNLSEVAEKCGVDYVYTLMKNTSGEIVFTALSVTKEEFEKKNFDKFYTVYKKPSELTIKGFGSTVISFEEYEDEYGYFRSAIVPMKSKNGKDYIVGADISIPNITARLNTLLYGFIIAGLLVFISTSAAFIFLIRKIS